MFHQEFDLTTYARITEKEVGAIRPYLLGSYLLMYEVGYVGVQQCKERLHPPAVHALFTSESILQAHTELVEAKNNSGAPLDKLLRDIKLELSDNNHINQLISILNITRLQLEPYKGRRDNAEDDYIEMIRRLSQISIHERTIYPCDFQVATTHFDRNLRTKYRCGEVDTIRTAIEHGYKTADTYKNYRQNERPNYLENDDTIKNYVI
jgi:hypothetical protein